MSIHHIFKVFAASVLTLLLCHAPLHASEGQDLKKTYDLAISLKTPTVAELTQKLTQKLGVFFSFDSSISEHRLTNISIHVRQKSLDDIIERIFADQKGFSYQVITTTVLLFYREEETPPRPDPIVCGAITDENGDPVAGAAIRVKGADRVAVTDHVGHYVIKAVEGETLVVSSIGFLEQQVIVDAFREDFRLEYDKDVLEHRVQVGYGSRKTDNLTGAATTVSGKRLQSRPVTDLVSGLQGLLPGVTVVSPSGRPGETGSYIRVRGVGTIGHAEPYVLIDYVEGNLDNLNPEDIESVTVLKDAASAAIYGMRAANGVVLVTTKKLAESNLRGVTTVDFGAYVGFQTPLAFPDVCNAEDYMTLENEARQNVGASALWTPADFETLRKGSDPDRLSDTDWMHEAYRKTALQQNYSLNVAGSLRKTAYYLSYRYLDQDALPSGAPTGNDRHNFRFKLNSNILERLNLVSNISYINDRVNSPYGVLTSPLSLIDDVLHSAPNQPVKYSDGSWAYVRGVQANPVARLEDGGYSRLREEDLSVTETLAIEILPVWNFKALYSFHSINGFNEAFKKTLAFRAPSSDTIHYWGKPNAYRNEDIKFWGSTLILTTDFDVQFGRQKKNKLNGVFGYTQEWNRTRCFLADRTSLPSSGQPSLHEGDPMTMTNDSATSTWGMRSAFGRLNYNYGNRYLLEFNFRYDESSLFPKDHRGGFFPSFSGAWRISEEKFMESTKTYLDNLKIRASWGVLGNQNVSTATHPYLTAFEQALSGSFSSISNIGHYHHEPVNPDLTWERVNIFNVGFDLAMFADRFNFTFDWFDKNTEGMLLQFDYPGQMGTLPSWENAGKLKNRGWEMNLSWGEQRGDFTYALGFHLSDVVNKITDLAGSTQDLSGKQVSMEGHPVGAIYGYMADGLMMPADFQGFDEDSKFYFNPTVPVIPGNNYQPGDIKYKDISGPEGKPDGVISPEHDRVVLGNVIPRLTYGIRGNLAWKGLDFSFLLQGVGKCDGYLSGAARHAFYDGTAVPQKSHLGRYHVVNNPDPHASYPRLTYGLSYNQNTVSSFWLQDASYFRIQNVQLGYTFPERWMRKAHIERLRIYVSGDNLATFSKFHKGFIPEVPVADGSAYPQLRTFVFGLNISFK